MEKFLAIAGLLANLVGVLLLFRYGMPFRIATDGAEIVVVGKSNAGAKLDRSYRRLGYLGLFLVLVGTGLQVAGVVYA